MILIQSKKNQNVILINFQLGKSCSLHNQMPSTQTALLALNNSKLMPLAISLKGRAFQSKNAPSTQTTLAGKAFLAANITEKSSTYHANCISNT